VLKGSRVDLVVGRPPVTVIEFKFPREPNEQNAAWTMALGEVLKDLYRLAVFPGRVDRLFVYVEASRLRRYMAGAARRYGLDLDVEQVALRPGDAARLPTTAAQIIGADLAAYHVKARRIFLGDIDEALRLAVYRVDPLETPPDSTISNLATQSTEPDPVGAVPAMAPRAEPQLTAGRNYPLSSAGTEPASPGTRDGARREILQAIRAVLARSGSDTFTPAQIVVEMDRRGTGYAESTIRTMVTAHMCRNAPDNAATTYDDLERVDRGVYRLTGHVAG
jgi:hypothetical protein